MLHIGIDEVGYGPLLGPLVVGIAVFRLPDGEDPAGDGGKALRVRLRGLVARRGRTGDAVGAALPVPVDDSKEIHRRYGLPGLARGVGAFAAAMDVAPPRDLEDLLCRFSDRRPAEFDPLPWYRDPAEALVPPYPWPGPLEPRLRARGIQALDLRVHPLTAREFNQEVRRLGNKAQVLGLLAGTTLLAALDRFPDGDADVVFDRHGGRLDYAGYLAGLLPFARVAARPAPRGEALYDLALPSRALRIRFATGADRRFLAVGWASVAAKLARELFMSRLNAWFAARRPGLRPTAGYVEDARRFLVDVGEVVAAEGVDLADLVRER